jgi:membrane protein YdbS with pleckstrin-like domain
MKKRWDEATDAALIGLCAVGLASTAVWLAGRAGWLLTVVVFVGAVALWAGLWVAASVADRNRP